MIRVTGPREPKQPPQGELVIDTTSRSRTWTQGLSPFILGPVKLWCGWMSKTVENGWQYSKVYSRHLGPDGWPSLDWFTWSRAGWANPRAQRYPMGKGAQPMYAYWQLEQDPALGDCRRQYDYVEARKSIFIPLYVQAVTRTQTFWALQQQVKLAELAGKDIWFWDYDGYDHVAAGMTTQQVIDNPKRIMGHAFILVALLEGVIPTIHPHTPGANAEGKPSKCGSK